MLGSMGLNPVDTSEKRVQAGGPSSQSPWDRSTLGAPGTGWQSVKAETDQGRENSERWGGSKRCRQPWALCEIWLLLGDRSLWRALAEV